MTIQEAQLNRAQMALWQEIKSGLSDRSGTLPCKKVERISFIKARVLDFLQTADEGQREAVLNVLKAAGVPAAEEKPSGPLEEALPCSIQALMPCGPGGPGHYHPHAMSASLMPALS